MDTDARYVDHAVRRDLARLADALDDLDPADLDRGADLARSWTVLSGHLAQHIRRWSDPALPGWAAAVQIGHAQLRVAMSRADEQAAFVTAHGTGAGVLTDRVVRVRRLVDRHCAAEDRLPVSCK
ncbi:hypothetical protein [Actinoplanes aureus]|jgi:hypothetical protein|uniref:Uncharacterized protein n=1 Tax=Actinoplanes aureus TaxID=2792083 RepID=A0A931G0U1_9ACTN|nr:hypothetical protein [Actinoplanes aureus]MBG0566067.1 hypothetical protein [Actinoplanes aureus]